MASSSSSNPGAVQQVNKASSDELLRKFAQLGEDRALVIRRQKRSRTDRNHDDEASSGSRLAERKCLLRRTTARRSSPGVLRHLRLLRAGEMMKNKPLFGAIEKTWRKTVEGASKVFIERHYNRHKRLISDGV